MPRRCPFGFRGYNVVVAATASLFSPSIPGKRGMSKVWIIKYQYRDVYGIYTLHPREFCLKFVHSQTASNCIKLLDPHFAFECPLQSCLQTPRFRPCLHHMCLQQGHPASGQSDDCPCGPTPQLPKATQRHEQFNTTHSITVFSSLVNVSVVSCSDLPSLHLRSKFMSLSLCIHLGLDTHHSRVICRTSVQEMMCHDASLRPLKI